MENTRVKLSFDCKCLKYSDTIPSLSCWFLVDKSLGTIENMQMKIRQRFSINRDLELFVDDCLLPTWESSDVLRENDNVIVMVKKRSKTINERKCALKLQNGDPHHQSVEESSEKEDSQNVDQSTVPQIGLLQTTKKCVLASETTRETLQPPDHVQNQDEAPEIKDTPVQVTDEKDENADVSTSKKKRRKRIRSRKRKGESRDTSQVMQAAPVKAPSNRNQDGSSCRKIPKLQLKTNLHRFQANYNDSGHIHFSQDSDDSDKESTNSQGNADNKTDQSHGSQTVTQAIESEYDVTLNVSNGVSDKPCDINMEDVTEIIADETANSSVALNKMCYTWKSPPSPIKKTFGSSIRVETPMLMSEKTVGLVSYADTPSIQDSSQGTDVLEILESFQGDSNTHQKQKRGKSKPGDLVKNVAVFKRKNMKRRGYVPLSKDQQLASHQENVSIILQNTSTPKPVNEERETRDETEGRVETEMGCNDGDTLDYTSLVTLLKPPQVGQTIAFKMLELSSNFTPEMSEFKVGKVLHYDPLRQCLNLAPLIGEIGGVLKDDFKSDEKFATLQWTSMIEPKLIE